MTRLVLIAWLVLAANSAVGDDSVWRVSFDTNWLGPAEAYVRIEGRAAAIRGSSLSGALALLRELPGDQQLGESLVGFEASRQEDGAYAGAFTEPWPEGELRLQFDGDSLEGSVEGGAFKGRITGKRVEAIEPIRNYPEIAAKLDEIMAAKVFSPADLETPGYRAFHDRVTRIAAVAADDLDLLLGVAWSWNDDPFSHFSFKRSKQSAEEMFAMFDAYRVGFDAATVEFDGNLAILTVRTMMGADTIEQIEAAYVSIAAAGATALIIDLRGNGGGAFAVKPLVEHLIDRPVDAGYFLSQVWNREHDRLPRSDEIMSSQPWQGWSIISFWKTVQESDILRVQFQPAAPHFDGPVYVLLDASSASATELAADAMRASGVATLIGQRTAGEMLSQSFFDVAEGFAVSLPVADYFSLEHGRIEGAGVPVDIEVAPETALDVAKEMARLAAAAK